MNEYLFNGILNGFTGRPWSGLRKQVAMADKLNTQQRHHCMSRIRGKDTKPELLVRKGLHARGFRFRLQDRKLPGRPDIVLPKYKVVIMVNGCFWHGHKGCKYATRPKTNVEFWDAKIALNRHRDEVTVAHLEALGWTVITVWECELKYKRSVERRINSLAAEISQAGERNTHNDQIRKITRAIAQKEQRQARQREIICEKEIKQTFSVPHKITIAIASHEFQP